MGQALEAQDILADAKAITHRDFYKAREDSEYDDEDGTGSDDSAEPVADPDAWMGGRPKRQPGKGHKHGLYATQLKKAMASREPKAHQN